MVFVGGAGYLRRRRKYAVRCSPWGDHTGSPLRLACFVPMGLLAWRRVTTRRYDSPARLLPAGNTARIFSLEKMSRSAKNSLEKVDTIAKNSIEKVVIMTKNSFKKVDR